MEAHQQGVLQRVIKLFMSLSLGILQAPRHRAQTHVGHLTRARTFPSILCVVTSHPIQAQIWRTLSHLRFLGGK